MHDTDSWSVLAGALNLAAALVRLTTAHVTPRRWTAKHTAHSRRI